MRTTAKMTGLAATLDDGLAELERATTAAMREAAVGLKEEYRDQVFGAGFGRRLAYTWQGESYPKSGTSLEPAAYVYSKAPKIISYFATGATVRPHGGNKYLWIPADQRARKFLQTADPVLAAESYYNTDLFFRRGRKGTLRAMVESRYSRSRHRKGRATKGPRRSAVRPILVFTLVRQVRGRKALDLEGPAQRWAAKVPALTEKHWNL